MSTPVPRCAKGNNNHLRHLSAFPVHKNILEILDAYRCIITTRLIGHSFCAMEGFEQARSRGMGKFWDLGHTGQRHASVGLGRLEIGLMVMSFAELGQDGFTGACLVSIFTASGLVQGGPSAGRTYRAFHVLWDGRLQGSCHGTEGGQRSLRVSKDATKQRAQAHTNKLFEEGGDFVGIPCSTLPIWTNSVAALAVPGHLGYTPLQYALTVLELRYGVGM